MKKLIAGLTTTALIASLSAPAFAANFTDVKGTTSEKSAGLLKAIGVVNGDVDGNFNPTNTITRAEFAKIAVKLAGLGSAADAYGINANTGFSDVPAGHWAAGYIAVAQTAGLVKGYGDGTFGANDNVKYEDVVTVMERILGYNDNLPGGYPNGYVVKGAALGLTAKAQFQVGKAATRGDVAIISNSTLGAKSVVFDATNKIFNPNTTSLFDQYFKNVSGFQNVSGQVAATDSTSLTIGTTKYAVTSDTIFSTDSTAALLGHDVTAYVDSNNNLVFAYDAVAATSVITGSLDATPTYSVSNQVYNVSVGGTSYTVASGAVLYFNGTKSSTGNQVDLIDASKATKGDAVTVVLNSAGKAEFVSVKHYANTNGTIIGNLYPATATSDARIDTFSTRSTTQYMLNGKPAQFSDLKAGDVYYYTTATDTTGTYANVVDVVRNVVSGTVGGYNTNTTGALTSITIGSTSYAVNSTYAGSNNLTKSFADSSIAGKATLTATLNMKGEVVSLATASTAVTNTIVFAQANETPYGVVVNNQVVTYQGVKLLLPDGTAVTKYIANDSNGNRVNVFGESTYVATAPTVKFVTGGVYQVSYDANGNITTATKLDTSSYTPGEATVGTNGIDTTNNTVTLSTGQTFNVTSSTVFLDISSMNAGTPSASSVKFVKFSNIYTGQHVRVIKDSTNNANVQVLLLDDSSGVGSQLSSVSGLFVSSRVSYNASGTASNYVTLNVNGANQDFNVASPLNGVAGDVYKLSDTTPADGLFDTLTPGTTVPVGSASTVDKYSTVANAVYFGGVQNSTSTFVYNNSTKVFVVKYTAGTDWRVAGNRVSTTAGSVSDFLQYVNNSATDADVNIQYTTTSSNVAGYPVLDTVVLYIPQN